jgi:hypothetical protein
MPGNGTYAAFISYSHATDHLLATPASARSRSIAKEVEWWPANRGRRTLFVVPTGGEAVWDNGVLGRERTTALPRRCATFPNPPCA